MTSVTIIPIFYGYLGNFVFDTDHSIQNDFPGGQFAGDWAVLLHSMPSPWDSLY